MNFIREQGGTGVGVTLSSGQVAACRRHGLDVHLYDARKVSRESFGTFDAVASVGGFEHFCSPERYRAGRQEEVYREFFARIASLLPDDGRLYAQTMVWGRNMIPEEQTDIEALKGLPPRAPTPTSSLCWGASFLAHGFPLARSKSCAVLSRSFA